MCLSTVLFPSYSRVNTHATQLSYPFVLLSSRHLLLPIGVSSYKTSKAYSQWLGRFGAISPKGTIDTGKGGLKECLADLKSLISEIEPNGTIISLPDVWVIQYTQSLTYLSFNPFSSIRHTDERYNISNQVTYNIIDLYTTHPPSENKLFLNRRPSLERRCMIKGVSTEA
jgi:hypothetical protein